MYLSAVYTYPGLSSTNVFTGSDRYITKKEKSSSEENRHQHEQHLTISVVDVAASAVLELDF